jgi:hypothetical protein
MAASSGDDVPAQLAALLGTAAVQIRKTDETPPRASVVDVIMAITGKNPSHSAESLRRLTSRYPEIKDKIVDLPFRGQGQRNTPVSDASGIVEIVMLLGGHHAKLVRRQAADLLARYLGGEPALVDEVCSLRNLQEALANEEPGDPLRFFGEAVEATGGLTRKRMLDDVRDVVRNEMRQRLDDIRDALHDEIRRHHVWSFSKRSKNHRELMEIGCIVHGNSLRELDENEHVIRIVDFLKDRIEASAWALHGSKFKSIYSVELKKMKLRECREQGLPPAVAFDQGEHRIVYTEADQDLMVQVLDACRSRFANIAARDAPLFLRPRRGQRSIAEFMQPRAASDSDAEVPGAQSDE